MRLLRGCLVLLAASWGAVPAAAETVVEDRAQVLAEIEAYLNGITTLDSRFVQSNPDGTTATGDFKIKRPHFARFAYDDPPTLLIARGQKYIFYDAEVGELNEGPVSASPASFLFRPKIRLDDDIRVADLRRSGGQILMTVEHADEPGSGQLMMIFQEDPMTLHQWYVRDAQNHVTAITLTEIAYGIELDDALFEFDHGEDRR